MLILEFLAGAVAGILVGRRVRGYSFGLLLDALIGGMGGLLLEWPATRIPGLGRFLGPVGNVEGLTPAILTGTIVLGFLGGVVLMLLAGFVKALIRT